MIKAVLLDLDDTLLYNPTRGFVSEYLRLIDAYFADIWQQTGLSRVLLSAVQEMNGQRSPHLSNADIAISRLVAATGRSVDELFAALNVFYADVYPQLKRCSAPIKGAVTLVEYLLGLDLAVVIATNPIYPPEAIRQRMAWAGIPDNFERYALVTHAGNMHFTKPNPAYYAEIAARIGVEPDEALMVGDSLENDIAPANQAGLYTYHVATPTDTSATGDLPTLYDTIANEGLLETLPPHPPTIAMIEPELRGNIGALFGMLADVQPHHWAQHPDPNEWSILEIVCHLYESENTVQRPRLQRILTEENPFLPTPPSPNPQSDSCDDGAQLAHQFAQARKQTGMLLHNLAPQDWQRPARHSIFGPTTLLEMAHFTAQHDRLHLNQLCQTLGRCE